MFNKLYILLLFMVDRHDKKASLASFSPNHARPCTLELVCSLTVGYKHNNTKFYTNVHRRIKFVH